MTIDHIGEVRAGEYVGAMHELGQNGGPVEGSIGMVWRGILPEDSTTDAENMQVFVAKNVLNTAHTELAAVVVRQDKNGEGVMDLKANSDAELDANFLGGLMEVALKESGVEVARLDDTGTVTPDVAEKAGFEKDKRGAFRLFGGSAVRRVVALKSVATVW